MKSVFVGEDEGMTGSTKASTKASTVGVLREGVEEQGVSGERCEQGEREREKEQGVGKVWARCGQGVGEVRSVHGASTLHRKRRHPNRLKDILEGNILRSKRRRRREGDWFIRREARKGHEALARATARTRP